MEIEELKYWLALSEIKGKETAQTLGLIDIVVDNDGNSGGDTHLQRKNLCDIFEKQKERRKQNSKTKTGKDKAGCFDRIEKELELAGKNNITIITLVDTRYPDSLRHIYDPPLVLYTRGSFYEKTRPVIAIVGTRRATHYGLAMSEQIAAELATAGIVVASGMARGCDTAAHKGALSADGHTVAVLGTGIDRVYPRENKKLYDEIAEKGLLLSEFPMNTPPLPRNFPLRNRIVSGISQGVLVAEAPLKSGAMMTARLALEGGKEVFALPGRARDKSSQGTNKLIKDGAALVEDARDIFNVLWPGELFDRKTGEQDTGDDTETSSQNSRIALTGETQRVAESLSGGPLHIDEISQQTGMTVQELSLLLLDMELKGVIEQQPGNLFVMRF